MSTEHSEHHFRQSNTIRDIVLGMSDGLTTPFALAAGLSGAVSSTGIIVTAGLAEITAGSIAMGLGGYLAAKTELEHYDTERLREVRETIEIPEKEAEEVSEIFERYGLTQAQAAPVVAALRTDRDRWVDFMMRFELGLERPDAARARTSAFTIGASYVVGGLVPLAPYMIADRVPVAFWWSVGVTLAALALFGYLKGRFTGISPWRGAAQTALIGGAAAAAAFAIASLFGQPI